MADVLYFNGRFTTTDERVLGVEDRGFQFGDAVYEVFKFVVGQPVFLLEHYRRLEAALEELEIRKPWNESTFASAMSELLARTSFPDGIVYIQVTRGEALRAHVWPDELEPTAIAYSRTFTFPTESKKETGVSVITATDRRWLHCNLKAVNLLASAIAKKHAARAGADEVILVSDGLIREGAMSSFFAVRNGGLITHPADEHILPGVVRGHTISLALEASIRVDEHPLREAELVSLDEAFVTSTTQGVMPVAAIDGRPIGNGRRGAITAELQRRFDQLEKSQYGRPVGA